MLRKLFGATALVVLLALAPLSALAARAAPVEITAFDLSPDCIVLGGTVNIFARVSNTTLFFQNTWGQGILNYNNGQRIIVSDPEGPVPVPPFIPITIRLAVDLPRQLPPGVYLVTGTIGPSPQDPDGWDSASDSVTLATSCSAQPGR